MTEKIECQRCGKKIPEEKSYIFKIFSYASPAPLDIGPLDLYRDIEWEIEEAVKEINSKSENELEEEVAVHFKYTLCLNCHRAMTDMFKTGKWKK